MTDDLQEFDQQVVKFISSILAFNPNVSVLDSELNKQARVKRRELLHGAAAHPVSVSQSVVVEEEPLRKISI